MSSNRDFANYMANWQQQSAAQRAEFERKIKADEAEFEALARLRTQRIAAEEIRHIDGAKRRPRACQEAAQAHQGAQRQNLRRRV